MSLGQWIALIYMIVFGTINLIEIMQFLIELSG
jgi:hypothetical protein